MVNPNRSGDRPMPTAPDNGPGQTSESEAPPDARRAIADMVAAVMLLLATLTYLGRLMLGLSQPGGAITPRDFGSLLAAIIAIVAGILLVTGVKPPVARLTAAVGAGTLFLFNVVNLTGGDVDDVIGKSATWAAIPIAATTFLAIVALYQASWSGTETATPRSRPHDDAAGQSEEPAPSKRSAAVPQSSLFSPPERSAPEEALGVIGAPEPEEESADPWQQQESFAEPAVSQRKPGPNADERPEPFTSPRAETEPQDDEAAAPWRQTGAFAAARTPNPSPERTVPQRSEFEPFGSRPRDESGPEGFAESPLPPRSSELFAQTPRPEPLDSLSRRDERESEVQDPATSLLPLPTGPFGADRYAEPPSPQPRALEADRYAEPPQDMQPGVFGSDRYAEPPSPQTGVDRFAEPPQGARPGVFEADRYAEPPQGAQRGASRAERYAEPPQGARPGAFGADRYAEPPSPQTDAFGTSRYPEPPQGAQPDVFGADRFAEPPQRTPPGPFGAPQTRDPGAFAPEPPPSRSGKADSAAGQDLPSAPSRRPSSFGPALQPRPETATPRGETESDIEDPATSLLPRPTGPFGAPRPWEPGSLAPERRGEQPMESAAFMPERRTAAPSAPVVPEPRQPEPQYFEAAQGQPTTRSTRAESARTGPEPKASEHAETEGIPAVQFADPPTAVLPLPGGLSNPAPADYAAAPQEPSRNIHRQSEVADSEPSHRDSLNAPHLPAAADRCGAVSPRPPALSEPDRAAHPVAPEPLASPETMPLQQAARNTPQPFGPPQSAAATPGDYASQSSYSDSRSPVDFPARQSFDESEAADYRPLDSRGPHPNSVPQAAYSDGYVAQSPDSEPPRPGNVPDWQAFESNETAEYRPVDAPPQQPNRPAERVRPRPDAYARHSADFEAPEWQQAPDRAPQPDPRPRSASPRTNGYAPQAPDPRPREQQDAPEWLGFDSNETAAHQPANNNPARSDGYAQRSPDIRPQGRGESPDRPGPESNETAAYQAANTPAPQQHSFAEVASLQPDGYASSGSGTEPRRPEGSAGWQAFESAETAVYQPADGRGAQQPDSAEGVPPVPPTAPIPSQRRVRQPVLRQPGGFLSPPPVDSEPIPAQLPPAAPTQPFDRSAPQHLDRQEQPPGWLDANPAPEQPESAAPPPDHVQAPPKRLAPLPWPEQ